MNHNKKSTEKQKGVSLIITFFIMIIILIIVMSIITLLYGEAKVIRNRGNSVASFYAAESGVEKVLYFDRQGNKANPKVSGLCQIFDSCIKNPNIFNNSSNADTSIYCDAVPGDQKPLEYVGDGCDHTVCNDCTISFTTTFDKRTYITHATISLGSSGGGSGTTTNLTVVSKGIFGESQRQIQITSTSNLTN